MEESGAFPIYYCSKMELDVGGELILEMVTCQTSHGHDKLQ